MFPERADANRIAAPAQGPCLFGVPVPLRAFGLAAGWQLPARGYACSDGSFESSGAGVVADDQEPAARVVAMATAMTAARTRTKTTEPQVAAA